MRRSIVLTSLIALLLAAACGPALPQSRAIALDEPTLPPTAITAVTDTHSLADVLRAAGAVVFPEGDVSQRFLRSDGVILRVNSQRVQVYEYPDDAAARADAARFSSDGAWISGNIGTTLVNWIATPHLYRAARVIAVYVGDDEPTLALLEAVIGAPFAGGANPYRARLPLES